MEDRIYDYWAATLQDGYIGRLADIVRNCGGARAMYEMTQTQLEGVSGISERLAGYITSKKKDIRLIRQDYERMAENGMRYVNHNDDDFPARLTEIPSMPYGLFVKGCLPDSNVPAAAIVGARECSEYGRLMAEYFGKRLAAAGVSVISGMAWGIDGISQMAALNEGGKSYAVLGCGVDITYPVKNRILYQRLSGNGNGLISEYAPGTPAESRRFPPRNRIISGLCDVLIVVEARAKSGTLITVDMAIDQGRTVMVVPGRLTDSLSAGCLGLLYHGALPVTGIESVLEQLGIQGSDPRSDNFSKTDKNSPCPVSDSSAQNVLKVLTLDPQSIGTIAHKAGLTETAAMIALSKLELQDLAKETGRGFFIKCIRIS